MFHKDEKDHPAIKSDIIPNYCRNPKLLIVFYHANPSGYIQYFYRSIKSEECKKSFRGGIESPKPDNDINSYIF